MANAYSKNPCNWEEIEPFVITEIEEITNLILPLASKEIRNRLLFYDTCSFRTHAQLSPKILRKLADYYYGKNMVVVITRCILMELASTTQIINKEYIEYLSLLKERGVKVILLNEEWLFDVLDECFATNLAINEYLVWAVRLIKSPVSTIEETLNAEPELYRDFFSVRSLNQAWFYEEFFEAVRDRKEPGDNLGEELIGICMYILSHLPGIRNGEICILTDDKGAAGKIGTLFKKTNGPWSGAKVSIYSTPKLVQHIYQETGLMTKKEMVEMISQGREGNIVVWGITPCDISVNDHISLSCTELVEKIMTPNAISIVF